MDMPKQQAHIVQRKRKSARNLNALVALTIDMFSDYLEIKIGIQENANTQKAVTWLK